MNRLVPSTFLFRWSFSVKKGAALPLRSGRLLNLPVEYRILSPAELDQLPDFADFRVAWNEQGLGFSVLVEGRSRKLNCNPEAATSSDGLHLWIDTRNTQTVHRATKFCHQFSFLPTGGGAKGTTPQAFATPLARSREESPLADVSLIEIRAEVHPDRYLMEIWLPRTALNGFDPDSHPRLGFHYVVRDRERGEQSLAVGNEFPYASDPSLWQTIELVDHSA